MIRLGSIEKALNSRFENLTRAPTHERVFRCERLHNDRPVSIYYFDASENVCSPGFQLDFYQEELIADDFFRHQGPLQWNYYLVFVLEDEQLRRLEKDDRLDEIQRNEEFARKYVVEASGIQAFVDSAVGTADSVDPSLTDIVDVWRERLDGHGLSALYGTEPRTVVVNRLKSGTLASDVKSIASPMPTHPPGTSFPKIVELIVKEYRRRPRAGRYQLSAVNLLSGPNGSGKTSFIEAVELCLCGSTLTNQGETGAELSIKLADGRTEEYEPDTRRYRERDKALYGRVYRTGNQMPESFARYNFFSSDAAFRLAYLEDAEQINSAFKELILGGEATRISKQLEGFLADLETASKQLAKEAHETENTIEKLSNERTSIEETLKESQPAEDTKDLLAKLHLDPSVRSLSARDLLPSISRAHAVLSSFLEELDWIRPISRAAVASEAERLRHLGKSLTDLESAARKKREAVRELRCQATSSVTR